MDDFTGLNIYRVRYIRVQFRAAAFISECTVMGKASAAFTAEAGADFALSAAFGAMVAQFAAWHCHKHSLSSLNDFQVADDKGIVNRDGAERLQFVPEKISEFDSNFCDFHGVFSVGV